MIRIAVLTIVISGLTIYAFKDWYLSLCGLISLMSVLEHPDMPKMLFEIPGLNLWNILLAVIVVNWALDRKRDHWAWDMPKWGRVALLVYVFIISLSFFRLTIGWDEYQQFATDVGIETLNFQKVLNDYLVNSVKWLVLGFLLFDGCRSKPRLYIALFAVGSIYLVLSLQVIKWIPLSYAISGESLASRSHSILRKEIGIHRTDVAVMLAGGAWAIFTLKELYHSRKTQFVFICASMITLLGLALTAGRGGYLAWVTVGTVLILMRWRKYGLLVVFAVLSMLVAVPGVHERIMEGVHIQKEPYESDSNIDVIRVTAGRSVAWPLIIEKIKESPWKGFGRFGILREGISYSLLYHHGEEFPHPHNAYLEMLLDNGIIGALPVFSLFIIFLIMSLSLFLTKSCPLSTAVGGLSSALLIAFLVGSFTGQSFYPQETNVGIYCGIGLMWRMYVENRKIDQI